MPDARRARLIGIAIAVVAAGLVAWGATQFLRRQSTLQGDPGGSSRTTETLDKMLARGEAAERAGDRGAAIVAYRFVLAVGSKGDPTFELYMAAARRGLARLGISDSTPPPSKP